MSNFNQQISDKVINYLSTNDYLTTVDVENLRKKAVEQKKQALTIFLEENPHLAEKTQQLIIHLDGEPKTEAAKKSKLEIMDEEAGSADANSFVYDMLKNCIEREASDIHIDMTLDKNGQVAFKLRYRMDGRCFDESVYQDIMLYRGIVNKLKLDAGLKIDERRLPQDGRISFELKGKVYNFRLSFMPSTIRNAQEEKIVLRQMADVSRCNLYELGILDYTIKYLEDAIKYPHGFICVTGPTGSGKTTTLYALLQEIDRVSKNVMTLEDPIEAEIPEVNQSQMFHRIGYDFAAGLRVILRQDPDIIMVGEMRDEETALRAFEAANTGHLVFSTLHTNTAASSITRLLQMGVPHYFISSSLKFIVAQRLARRVCTECRREHPDKDMVTKEIDQAFESASPHVKKLYKEASAKATLYAPYSNGKVCERCHGTGYKGRIGIFEIMKISDDIRHVISFENGNEDKIQDIAEKEGMLTIQQYGYLMAMSGITTFEEVNTMVLSN
jgi:type II secretory ATPase GspE/PulE/Tfp pilus assembly ATPase PilB-like protein